MRGRNVRQFGRRKVMLGMERIREVVPSAFHTFYEAVPETAHMAHSCYYCIVALLYCVVRVPHGICGRIGLGWKSTFRQIES